jgi:hypothetical protein
MSYVVDSNTASETVLLQAADIATQAIQTAATRSLRAADGCGCGHCRARAARTVLWAVAMLHAEDQSAVDDA